MNLEEKVAILKGYQKKIKAFNHVSNLLVYDASTAMPAGGVQSMSETMGVISGEIHSMTVDPTFKSILYDLFNERKKLDFQTCRETEELYSEQKKRDKVPKEELIAMEEAENLAAHHWEAAKKNNDFAAFSPYLKKLIEMKKRYAGYINPGADVYDTLLDEYERGMTKAKLEPFFAALRRELVPLIAEIRRAGQPKMSFLFGNFEIEQQKVLSEYVMDVMGIDRQYCSLQETEHPFTIRFSKNDVRITTKYLREELTSNLYSVVHEGGHAMYELSVDDALSHSVLGAGASTAMHEAQARLWENNIGRSLSFCEAVFPKIKELFPVQMKSVTTTEFYRAVNGVRNSATRLDADELAYALHVLIRYEIEKLIFDGSISVDKLPEEWNRLYKQYLGIDVPDHAHGVLSDAHWSGGAFGYFPCYALGTAYAAQIFEVLQKAVDLEGCAANKDFTPARQWLTEKIYRFGKLYTPDKLIWETCGEAFNPDYYTAYLKRKFGKLYQI